jgi:predicted DNA-binding transcriptional regulator AlpA
MSPLWKDGDKWLNLTQVANLISGSRNTVKPLTERFIDPLPQPFPFGQSRRWLASQVWAWMERQMSRGSTVNPLDNLADDSATETEGSAQSTQFVVDVDLWINQLKTEYESGTTLDELCRQHRLGKARLSALLRNAGAAMRKPGRRGEIAKSTEAITACQGVQHVR